MSADLQWLLLRKNNSFIVNRTVEGPIFSSEPGNLRNLHSFKYSGLPFQKTVGITASTETGGLTLHTRVQDANPRHVKKAVRSVPLKSNAGQRRIAKIIAVETASKGYRPDLRTSALARASAIQAAQLETASPSTTKEKKPRHKAAAAAPTEVEA